MSLYTHLLEDDFATGVGHYVRRLVRAIAALELADLEYLVGASPGRGTGPRSWELPVRRPRFSRKALHLAWGVAGRPRLHASLGSPDLVHVLNPSTPVPTRAPVIYTVHDLFPLSHPQWYRMRERWLFGRALADALERASAIVVNSNATAGHLASVLGGDQPEMVVIPMGVDDAFFCPPNADQVGAVCRRYGVVEKQFLVVVGAISARKNLPVLLEALAGMEPARRPTLLALGPDGPGAQAIFEQVERLGLRGCVLTPGWVPDEDLVALIAAAQALVHPSLDEGFGMTPLEAMAAGVPTAVSAAGALPEVVGEASLLVQPANPQAWAQALERLAEDAELRTKLVSLGRQRASQFRWQAVAQKTVSLHRKVLGTNGRPSRGPSPTAL